MSYGKADSEIQEKKDRSQNRLQKMQHVSRDRPGKSEKMIEYTNSQISHLIDEHIHRDRNRKILKRRFIDGHTFEQIAEEFDLSVRQVKNIVYKSGDRILNLLK